ncbi:hypothetical protein M0802_009332 [Mischocyttarus mexicanus]|nr:hypothetical protein M0802_009332 [Mischocyttarus mexicanus]
MLIMAFTTTTERLLFLVNLNLRKKKGVQKQSLLSYDDDDDDDERLYDEINNTNQHLNMCKVSTKSKRERCKKCKHQRVMRYPGHSKNGTSQKKKYWDEDISRMDPDGMVKTAWDNKQ